MVCNKPETEEKIPWEVLDQQTMPLTIRPPHIFKIKFIKSVFMENRRFRKPSRIVFGGGSMLELYSEKT